MQSASIQRNSQRRTALADDVKNYQYAAPPTPTQPTYGASQQGNSRSSSGSGGMSARTSSGRKRDPSQQLSQIEKSVTHLLIATKQLLETLTQWSRHQATEGDVSDVYVRLGYEFNIACRAFTSIGVDVSDLGNVPDLLRTILEDTLSQDPSPASLDRYLPRIRDIIINLLHGLKRKQQKLRTRQGSNGQMEAPRQGSMMSSTSDISDFDTSAIAGDVQSRLSAASAYDNKRTTDSFSSTYAGDTYPDNQRASSPNNAAAAGQIPQDQINTQQADTSSFDARRMPPSVASEDSITKDSPLPSLPIQLPSPTITTSMDNPGPPPLPPSDVIPKDFPAPPPVPPAQPRSDALAQLQRGGELERRASRRYSAYQISKHLGQSQGGVPMIPPTQHGPIPNRGKEQRDSLNAVRSRSSLIRSRSSRFADSSPARTPTQQSEQGNSLLEPAQQGIKREGSPLSQLATVHDDKLPYSPSKPDMSATLSGPLDMTTGDYLPSPATPITPANQLTRKGSEATIAAKEEPVEEPFVPAQSPEPGKPLTLFLQYKSKIKKCVLPEGSSDLTVARLQLAFIEKFAWHTYNNGVDLPEIYIQDPVSGVRHELEDLTDIKDRTVLVLNVEAVDEVKRHFDGALGGIRSAIDGMRTAMEKQQTSIQQVSTKQEEASKEMARLAAAPPPAPVRVGGKLLTDGARSLSGDHMSEVQTLRRDLAVMRQTLTGFTSGIKSSMDSIREKAEAVKTKAASTALPSSEGESGRAYVNAGKKTVGDDSENLVNRVDDLQDIVEDLRKDVTRGVRPRLDQVQNVTADIQTATELLNKMKEMVKKEKPVWTKIWEKELELVCTDREFLTMQEELIIDLEDDLEKANQTFALVQEATKQQQSQQASTGGAGGNGFGAVSLRNVSRGFGADIDPETARAGVMGEVKALQPNHESRLEAIERAEKARKKDLAARKDGEFTKELSKFVEDGKLRRTGGFEEIERQRIVKDDQNLKVTWDVEQEDKARRKQERAEKKRREAAERAAQAAAEEDAEGGGGMMPNGDDDEFGDGEGGDFEIGPDGQIIERHRPPRIEDDASSQNGFHAGGGGEGDAQRKSWLPSIFSG